MQGSSTTSGLAGRTHGQAPTAEAVIDGAEQSVLVDLTPLASAILTDLAKALTREKQVWHLGMLAHVPATSREHSEYLRRLLANPGVTGALQVLLSTTGAAALAEQLDEAALTRDECLRDGCANLAGHDGLLCDAHHDDASGLSQLLRGA